MHTTYQLFLLNKFYMLDLTSTMLCIFSSEFDVPGGQKKIPISIDKSSLHPLLHLIFFKRKQLLQALVVTGISCPGEVTPCSGNGQCDLTSGVCTCSEGHQGVDCSGKTKYNKMILSHHNQKVFHSRTVLPRRLHQCWKL